MIKTWVSNTSPLIFLSKIDRLDLLSHLAKIQIPSEVLEEIESKDDLAKECIEQACYAGKIEVIKIAALIDEPIHIGEKAAISLAVEIQPELILLDDEKAKKIARNYSLKPVGTLGVLLIAKKRGLITKVKPEIEKLLANNFRATDDLIYQILKQANE
jgi:uncharacterized protein